MMRIRSNLGISDLAQMNSSDSSPILLNFIQMHLGVHTMTQATSSADNTTVTRFLGSTLRHGVNLLLVRRISPRATGHLVRGGILIRIEMLVLMIDSWYVTVTNVWTKTWNKYFCNASSGYIPHTPTLTHCSIFPSLPYTYLCIQNPLENQQSLQSPNQQKTTQRIRLPTRPLRRILLQIRFRHVPVCAQIKHTYRHHNPPHGVLRIHLVRPKE